MEPKDRLVFSPDALVDAQDRVREDRLTKTLALTLGATLPLVGALTGNSAVAAEVEVQPQTLTPIEDLAKTETISPGSLVLSDFFDARTGPAHGPIVEQSSRDIGFQSKIVKKEAPGNQALTLSDRFFSRLDNRTFSPQEMKQYTYDYIKNRQMGNLQSATEELNTLTEADVRGTVLNLSRGSGKAQIMESVYERVQLGWDHNAYPQSKLVGERRVQKLAPALGLDAESVLQGKDGARAVFQKRLLALIDEASADQEVAAAQTAYDQAVADFEAKGNSVVVAAGNSGRVMRMLQMDSSQVDVAPDFFRNLLANDQVTTVGSTRRFNGSEMVADYTNKDSGIDLYADGDIGNDWGTSFATPRIGSIMARLHQENPHATSEQVEAMVGDRFGQKLDNYGDWPTAPAVDEAQVKEWLPGRVF